MDRGSTGDVVNFQALKALNALPGYITGDLYKTPAVGEANDFFHLVSVHIIQHDNGGLVSCCLPSHVQVLRFHHNSPHKGDMGPGLLDGRPSTSSCLDVVIF